MNHTKNEGELLARYVENRDQEAFAGLVAHYQGLVFASARRQLHDASLAEDVSQAVFLVLASKAKSVKPPALTSWLLQTTRLTALAALRQEARQRRLETQAAEERAATGPGSSWLELQPHLDEALCALSEKDRTALLLRFYEKMPDQTIGKRLGMSGDAANKRINRALDKLRFLFRKKGLQVSGTALTGLLSTQLAAEAPAGLAAGIIKAHAAALAGGLFATGPGSGSVSTLGPAVSSHVLPIFLGVKTIMFISAVKHSLAVAAVVALMLTGTALLVAQRMEKAPAVSAGAVSSGTALPSKSTISRQKVSRQAAPASVTPGPTVPSKNTASGQEEQLTASANTIASANTVAATGPASGIERKMEEVVASFGCPGLPISQVLTQLSRMSGIDIRLDPAVEVNRDEKDRFLARLKFQGLKFKIILNWAIRHVDLEWVVLNDTVLVSTPEDLMDFARTWTGNTIAKEDAHTRQTDPLEPSIDTRFASPDAQERVAAVWAATLDASSGEKTLALLEKALVDPDDRVRMTAVDAFSTLARSDRENMLTFLETALAGPDERVRETAVKALAGLGGERALTLLEKALVNADAHLREEISDVLLMNQDGEKALPIFEERLADPDPQVRKRAVHSLAYGWGGAGKETREKAWPFIEKALADTDPQMRESISGALLRNDEEKVLPFFEERLADPDPRVRENAVKGLRLAGEKTREKAWEKACLLIEKAFADPEPQVRTAAVEVLGNMGGERALALLDIACADSDTRVRALATEVALKQVASKEPAVLERFCSSPDPQVRTAAVNVLRYVGGERALALLDIACADSDTRVRAAAESAREKKLGEKKALALLEEQLGSPDAQVHKTVLRELGRLDTGMALPLLDKALADPDVGVRGLAVSVLLAKQDKYQSRDLLKLLITQLAREEDPVALQFLCQKLRLSPISKHPAMAKALQEAESRLPKTPLGSSEKAKQR